MQHCPALHKAQAAGTKRTKQWARMVPYVQIVTRMTSNSWTGRSQGFWWPLSSFLQATRWFRVRTKIMVLLFQDNGETPVGLIRLLWTLACRKRREQKTQSGCKTKINTALSKAFIPHNFCCHPCFPRELGGEGPAVINAAPIDLLPWSCTEQPWPNSAPLWVMESLSCDFKKPFDGSLCLGRCSRGKAR